MMHLKTHSNNIDKAEYLIYFYLLFDLTIMHIFLHTSMLKITINLISYKKNKK